jgi:beta-galactosidase
VEAKLLSRQTQAVEVAVSCEVISPAGKLVAKFHDSEKVKPLADKTLQLAGKVAAPELWSPESPRLYQLITTVRSGGKIVDRKETEFGIRTIAFDPTNGFLLNGQHYEIHGMCNHQDAAGVGVALPDALQYFRVAKLKEMGCNAYRTAHNAPTPELLEACDRLGMLVLDENRLFGSDAANLEQLKGQILRDRNHPSIFAWSLGNEEWNAQDTAAGAAVTKAMQNVAHLADATRPCTLAVNSGSYGDFGIFPALDVKGFNYHFESMDAYHAAFPAANILGTEQASSIGTRGIYTNDASRGYISAYDDHNPRWGCSAEEWWSFFATRPWASGGFDWTGFDYRGEPTPYQWPCISSHFGILDTCGFPKDNFWYYQSWWTTNIVLHLLPHWNWPGREGQEISVRALSNCQEVELFLNGQSLGRRSLKKNSELKWTVKYTPGTLSAEGYNDGRLVAETKVETTGASAAIQLGVDRTTINADGQDVSVIAVSVTDAQGRVMPVATNRVHFELSGPGKIIGVGNGDPTCHEPDTLVCKPNIEVVPVNDGWHYKILADVKNSQLAELQAGFDDSSWNKVDTQANAESLKEPGQAIYRTKFSVAADELVAESVQLKIGRIDDSGRVYINGKLVGESHDWAASPSFDIKPFLHTGENTMVVAVINEDGFGGLGNGIALRFYKKNEVLKWQRSVFNGLAQVIVQSTAAPGEIKLTASADGLTPASARVQSQASRLRKNVSNLDAGSLDIFQPVTAPTITGLMLKPGDRLAICGDSITEQRMYSRLMEDYLTVCVPQLDVSVRQYGWSGEQVPGFLTRMTNDCLRFAPTIATTCYGMNDFGYRPYENRIGQTYQANSTRLVEAFKANGVKVVLGSPGCVSKVPPWVRSGSITVKDLNLSLCQLRNLDVAVANQEKVRFADVFWPMLAGEFAGRQAYGTNYGIPGNEGVHPHWAGHAVMAYVFLKALGLNGDIGTFTIDLKKDRIKVSAGHKVISSKAGEYEIESSRYPFCPCAPEGLAAASYPVCGQDGLDSDNSIRSGLTLVPFYQQLNRLTLIVKNGLSSRYQVTWGNQSRMFTGAQLAAGINLAAEFPVNPFTVAFAKVDAAVAAKQAYETQEMQKIFRGGKGMNLEQIRGNNGMNMEQIAGLTDRVAGEAEKEHDALVASVHASFMPVTHIIKISAQ